MSIDWSLFALSKGTPKADAKAARTRTREAQDEAESAKVKIRSKGQCEVVWELKTAASRCDHRATEIHHLIGGWGRRARGESLRAERKLHACGRCHQLITSHRLRRIGGEMPHYTDVFVRVK